MVAIIVIEKSGNIKEVNVNSVEPDDLHKKAGFKSPNGFELQTTWNVELKKKKYLIDLYAKTQGRAGQENKYEFPPPVDNELYFGSCLIINRGNPLKKSEWEEIYNHLYGGFEDLNESDSEEEEEKTDMKKTKNGYYKDGFVVDDDSVVDDDYDDSDDSDEIDSKNKKQNLYNDEELEEEEYV
jgi:hypothetical protein